MKLMYFAWMREHIGSAEENIELPQGVATVAELVTHLREISPGHAKALSNMELSAWPSISPMLILRPALPQAMKWPFSRRSREADHDCSCQH